MRVVPPLWPGPARRRADRSRIPRRLDRGGTDVGTGGLPTAGMLIPAGSMSSTGSFAAISVMMADGALLELAAATAVEPAVRADEPRALAAAAARHRHRRRLLMAWTVTDETLPAPWPAPEWVSVLGRPHDPADPGLERGHRHRRRAGNVPSRRLCAARPASCCSRCSWRSWCRLRAPRVRSAVVAVAAAISPRARRDSRPRGGVAHHPRLTLAAGIGASLFPVPDDEAELRRRAAARSCRLSPGRRRHDALVRHRHQRGRHLLMRAIPLVFVRRRIRNAWVRVPSCTTPPMRC